MLGRLSLIRNVWEPLWPPELVGENVAEHLFSEQMTPGCKLATNFPTYLLGTREVARPL